MGKWDERIADHPVNVTFDNAFTALKGLDKERLELAPDDVQRLIWILEHVRTRLTRTPAMAVPMQTLDQLNSQIGQIVAELSNFIANGNVVHLSNAMNSADAILETARVLRPLDSKGRAEDADAYLGRIQDLVAKVVKEANEQLREIGEDFDSRAATAASQWDTLQEQFATSTDELARMRNTIAAQTSRLEQALRDQEAQFMKDEKSRADAFDLADKERQEATNKAAHQLEEQFSSTSERLEKDAAGTLAAISELKIQADELLGAIGVEGVAAGYNATAKQEKAVADRWRIATVAVAVLAAGVLFSALWVDHSGVDSWQRLATRLILSLSFAGLAAYCGRQSAEHRRVERDTRDRRLQLAALNPYLANMPSDTAVKLKEDLAPGYFKPVVADDQKASDTDGGLTLPVSQIVGIINALLTKGAGGR